jgi:hypothetical protein
VVVFVPKWWKAAAGELLDLIDENGMITFHGGGAVSLPLGCRAALKEQASEESLLSELRRKAVVYGRNPGGTSGARAGQLLH